MRLQFYLNRSSEVRLVDEHGSELGVFSLSDALALAQSQEKDLVEIDPEITPPLCQVIDYGKYRFQVQERRKWRRHE